MSKICLIRPLLSQNDFSGYPLNLLILAACLMKKGHTVEILDFDFLKLQDASWLNGNFAKKAALLATRSGPDFVGITSMCSNYVLALDLAAEIKALDPNIHITFGGPHVSLCSKETLLGYSAVDTAVLGEGEITYPDLIDHVERKQDLAKVAGIAYRTEARQVVITSPRPLLADLNESPRPAYELVNIPGYVKAAAGNFLEIYAGSGCPFKCTFCSTSIVWERKYRTIAAERIAGEMEFLSKTYGAYGFNLIHDNLTTDKEFLHAIADAIRERSLMINWGFSSRIDTIDQETIEKVSSAGCNYIFFGIESGSEKIQKTMKKRLNITKITPVLQACLNAGIAPTTSFILGFPNEEKQDISDTVRLAFLCRVAGAKRSFINLLSAYTGTPLMMQHLDKMTYNRQSINTTMSSFLEPHHYETIQADKFIFANYYSLDYSQSFMSAQQYGDMVDFYTICLNRYRFTFSFLLNDAELDPLDIFSAFQTKIKNLGVRERVAKDLNVVAADFSHIPAQYKAHLKTLLGFDNALWQTKSGFQTMIFKGPIRISKGDFKSQILTDDSEERHYLLTYAEGEDVRACKIPPSLSQLYQVQGLQVMQA